MLWYNLQNIPSQVSVPVFHNLFVVIGKRRLGVSGFIYRVMEFLSEMNVDVSYQHCVTLIRYWSINCALHQTSKYWIQKAVVPNKSALKRSISNQNTSHLILTISLLAAHSLQKNISSYHQNYSYHPQNSSHHIP